MIEGSKGHSLRIVSKYSMQLKRLHTIFGDNSTTWTLLTALTFTLNKYFWHVVSNVLCPCHISFLNGQLSVVLKL